MIPSKPNYVVASQAIPAWRDNLLAGNAPVRYPVGEKDLGRIEVGPGLVVLLGGAPGAGKTALTMQLVLDGLRVTPDLKALVCNVEMPPEVLLDRQLARLSGVDLTTIRDRKLGEVHQERIDIGIRTLTGVADRLCFLRPPFTIDAVGRAGSDFGAQLLVLDYIQRIAPPGEHKDTRAAINASMSMLRRFADVGAAVMVISAVGRAKDGRGQASYEGDSLNLASFRESSELEFGADSAFILVKDSKEEDSSVTLKHLKDRHGECRDIHLNFDRAHQAFRADEMPDFDALIADKKRKQAVN